MNEVVKSLAMGVLYDFLGYLTTKCDSSYPSSEQAIMWLQEYKSRRGLMVTERDAPPIFHWHDIVNLKSQYASEIKDYGIVDYRIEKVNTIIGNRFVRFIVYSQPQIGYGISYKDMSTFTFGMGDNIQEAMDDYAWKKFEFFCGLSIDFHD